MIEIALFIYPAFVNKKVDKYMWELWHDDFSIESARFYKTTKGAMRAAYRFANDHAFKIAKEEVLTDDSSDNLHKIQPSTECTRV